MYDIPKTSDNHIMQLRPYGCYSHTCACLIAMIFGEVPCAVHKRLGELAAVHTNCKEKEVKPQAILWLVF